MTDFPDRKTRRTWTTTRAFSLVIMTLIVTLVGIVAWSTQARISGAVIGKGTIEVSTTMTPVQHPIGGVIEEIYARNGDPVAAGDVLVRLDSKQLQSDLKVVEGDLFETLANIARLEAVIDNRETIEFHPLLRAAAEDSPELQRMVNRQRMQLAAHFTAVTSGRDLLREQIVQIRAEIEGVIAQIAAKTDELDLMASEIANAEKLAENQLIRSSQLFALRRDDVKARGELGNLEAKVASLRGKISELTLKQLAVVPTAQEKAEEALSKLRPLRTRYLEQRLQIAGDLTRLEIRAPVSGTIHQSAVLGKRSVVVAAVPLMMIVPDGDPIRVAVKIDAADIDQVHVGQQASLKFKAYSQRSIPIILGDVSRISADALSDPVTKSFYYDVKVDLQDTEMSKLDGRKLLPGMPVEAFMATESQTAIKYVLQPIKYYFDRAFRDT